MTTIVGIAGSLRARSFNRALLRAAAARVPGGATVEIHTFDDVPVYNGDLEAAGMPPSVEALKSAVAAADALLLVTPEYNGSIPGPFKNAIDWMTRPPKDIGRVFGDKPVGLIGATPGRAGTRLAQQAWLAVFRQLSMRLYTGRSLYVAGAAKAFDDELELVDPDVDRLLREFVEGFVGFARG